MLYLITFMAVFPAMHYLYENYKKPRVKPRINLY